MTGVKRLHLLALYKAKRYESLWHFLDEIQPDIANYSGTRFLVIGTVNTRPQMIEVAQYAQRLWPEAEIVTEFASSFASSRAYINSDFVVQIVGYHLGPSEIPHAHVIKCRWDVMIDAKRELTLTYREPQGLP